MCPLDRQPLDYDALLESTEPPATSSREIETPGAGFDVSTIAPQIQRVRQDHLAALKARPHSASNRAKLVALARGIIVHFPFFRRERPVHEVENHAA